MADAGDARQAKANLGERLGKGRAPGQKPEENQAVEKKEGDGVVVDGIAFAEIAEELFVDEIKPEEALGLASGGIAEGGENMPGSRDEKKDEGAGKEMHLQEMPQVAREKQEDENDGAGEDDADESFGENIESDDAGDAPAGKKRGLFGLPAVEEEIESDADPKADGDVGNEDAREEIRTAGGEENYGGPEAGLRLQEAAAEEVEQEGQGEDAEMEGEAGAPGVDAEEFEAEGDPPIGKRGFFEVAGVGFVESDPVVADENFGAGVGVRSVNIVLKGRGEEAGAVDGEPQEKEDDERGPCA